MKINFNAPLTLVFALLTTLALGINTLSNGWFNSMFAFYFTSWLDPMMYLRLITYPFCHANFSHLLNNMMLFLVLGPILEAKYKPKRMIVAMLFTSVISGIAHLILAPRIGLVGCSGIVFMMIILASFAGNGKGIPLTFIFVFILYIGGQIISAIQVNNISELAHIFGALCGAYIGFKMR